MSFLVALRARLRRERAQAALEGVIVIPLIIVVPFIVANIVFLFGSSMLLQSSVNTAALQTSMPNCVNGQVLNQLRNASGLGAQITNITATYLKNPPGTGNTIGATSSGQYYEPSTSDFIETSGPNKGAALPVGGNLGNATGTGDETNCIPDGAWVFIQLTYTQHFALLSSQTERVQALVVSGRLGE